MEESVLILTGFVVFGLLIWFISEGRKTHRIKQYGIKARGVIIENNEDSGGNETLDGPLGGNINEPVIRFTIEDGSEIVGRPVTGFISQHEVLVPSYINIIYDPKEPAKFIIDPD
jgi:hypothetical protein